MTSLIAETLSSHTEKQWRDGKRNSLIDEYAEIWEINTIDEGVALIKDELTEIYSAGDIGCWVSRALPSEDGARLLQAVYARQAEFTHAAVMSQIVSEEYDKLALRAECRDDAMFHLGLFSPIW